MLQFCKSNERWWQKPLVELSGKLLPAELVVLRLELKPGEAGAWLNSRGTMSGVVNLIQQQDGTFKTIRLELPRFVSGILNFLYETTGVRKGMPDLIIWNVETLNIRFVEVKCPHWDSLSKEQIFFIETAKSQGISTLVIEWEFESSHSKVLPTKVSNKRENSI